MIKCNPLIATTFKYHKVSDYTGNHQTLLPAWHINLIASK